MFSIKPKTLHYWYKENLSSYTQAVAEGKWGEKKILIADKDTGEIIKEKPVPIAKPENIGKHINLLEKKIIQLVR